MERRGVYLVEHAVELRLLVDRDVALALLIALPHAGPVEPQVLDTTAGGQVLLDGVELQALRVGRRAAWVGGALGHPAMADAAKLVLVFAAHRIVKVELDLDNPAAERWILQHRLQRRQRRHRRLAQLLGTYEVVFDATRLMSDGAACEPEGRIFRLELR